jgi:2-hydroxycyclohexanecarboxyl-CoA dehydrogenase
MNQFAVVTGGATGIGLEVARQLLGAGLRVAIVDLDGEQADAAARRIGGDGGRAVAIAGDVANLADIRAAAEKIHAMAGRVTHVVSNAGWGPNRRFLETTVEEQDRIIAVNYVGALNVCRVFLPGMVETGWGRIVLIGSDAGRVGTPKEAVYAGAKAALAGFAKSLAVEVARYGVTVNVVSPGSTDTEFIRRILDEQQLARRIKANPMGRLGTPGDVAAAVAFLCGESASYISGQVLSVNGAMSRLG